MSSEELGCHELYFSQCLPGKPEGNNSRVRGRTIHSFHMACATKGHTAHGGRRGMWRDCPDTPRAHTSVCNKPSEASQNGHGRGTQQDNLHNAPGNPYLHHDGAQQLGGGHLHAAHTKAKGTSDIPKTGSFTTSSGGHTQDGATLQGPHSAFGGGRARRVGDRSKQTLTRTSGTATAATAATATATPTAACWPPHA